jgi:hypothetical protein
LPPRYLNRQQMKRLSPFEGLMIDAQAWTDAHLYHQEQQRLHALAFHGAGIVTGLEVTANASPDLSVIIHPGLAVDPEGNVILVTRAQRYYLQPKERGFVYLVIEFREIPSDRAAYAGDQPTRLVEAYRIQQRDSLPDTPHLELARIRLESASGPVIDAKDPHNPGADSIDGRYRQAAAVRLRDEVALGALAAKGSQPPELALRGLRNLARELTLGETYRAAYRGLVQLGRDAGDCTLLYLAGSGSLALDQNELATIGVFLQSGGVLLAEALEGGQGSGFATGIRVLAERLGAKLAAIERGHPLLDARYPFSLPPPGAVSGGEILEGGGVILSALDYGSAWAGGTTAQPLGRGAIRDALEFGVNAVAYGEARRRLVALKQPSL